MVGLAGAHAAGGRRPVQRGRGRWPQRRDGQSFTPRLGSIDSAEFLLSSVLGASAKLRLREGVAGDYGFGGALIDAGDIVIDGSIKGKLARLQSALSH
jgi:hypothetical protein